MEEPFVYQKKSLTVRLDPGVYFYCRCGKTENQPFCDGHHKGTSFEPKKFTITEPASVSICLCRHTENSPFCDGSHRRI